MEVAVEAAKGPHRETGTPIPSINSIGDSG